MATTLVMPDDETDSMRSHGLSHADQQLENPLLDEEERAKWERIRRIVQGDRLQDVYPQNYQPETE